MALRNADTSTISNHNGPPSTKPATIANGESKCDGKMTASEKVFNIPELLEHILSFLPFKDLLLGVRVNKRFQAVVINTKKLKQQLHITPISQADANGVTRIPVTPPNMAFDMYTVTVVLPIKPQASDASSNCLISVKSFPQMSGSWTGMLAFQPPVCDATFEMIAPYSRFGYNGPRTIGDGTLGSIMEYAKYLAVHTEFWKGEISVVRFRFNVESPVI